MAYDQLHKVVLKRDHSIAVGKAALVSLQMRNFCTMEQVSDNTDKSDNQTTRHLCQSLL